jgi:hypothetical protein
MPENINLRAASAVLRLPVSSSSFTSSTVAQKKDIKEMDNFNQTSGPPSSY